MVRAEAGRDGLCSQAKSSKVLENREGLRARAEIPSHWRSFGKLNSIGGWVAKISLVTFLNTIRKRCQTNISQQGDPYCIFDAGDDSQRSTHPADCTCWRMLVAPSRQIHTCAAPSGTLGNNDRVFIRQFIMQYLWFFSTTPLLPLRIPAWQS